MLSAVQPLTGLLAAIAAGLLVGMERGWAQRAQVAGSRVAGLRTFGLVGLTGGLGALLPDIIGAALAAGVAAVFAVGYWRGASERRLSATTTIAAILTFAAGFACVRVSPTAGLAAAGATFVLLSARQSLHGLLRGLGETEIEAAARFVLVALVVLPLLPDAAMGPYDAWNPRRIWMVVVLVMGLSFAGFVLARRVGAERGTVLVAMAGAVVSSTAATLECARRLRDEPDARGALTAGIAMASIVMFLRVQLLTLLLVPRALPGLAMAIAPATLTAIMFGLIAWRGQSRQASTAPPGNPLGFRPALLLAGLVAGLSVLSHWALERFGQAGIAVVLGLTGLTDVDAAVLTLAGLPAGAMTDDMAGLVLAVPVLANTAVKAAMTLAIGWGHGGLRASAALWASLAASAIAITIWQMV